jgi:hypothetical protein
MSSSSIVVADRADVSSSVAIGPARHPASDWLGGMLRKRSQITKGRVASTIHYKPTVSIQKSLGIINTNVVVRERNIVKHVR